MKRLAIAAWVLLGAFALCGATSAVCAQNSSSSVSKAAHKTPGKKKKRRHSYQRMRLPKAPTADRIMEIQDALARNGCYDGEPTGKWDASSIAGMRKFQEDHGLDGTGKIDALTLQKLGLGSEIAGAFAPRPVTQPTSTSPSTTPPGASKPQPPKPSVGAVSTSTSTRTTSTSAAPGVTPVTSAAASTASKPSSPPQPQ